jgi:cyclopropane-fatty-acyl-phospholipid synthase
MSRAQHEWAKSEVERRGLSDRVDVRLGDYRDVGGTYDKVVSVGLTEHLPPSEYPALFRKVVSVLKPSSNGLTHCVGTNKYKPRRDAFTQKYIFPGSCQVELPAVVTAMQKAGLAVLDVENMKPHYALTLAAWLSRFRAGRDGGLLDAKRYDEVFCRMWEYYLCCGIAASRASDGALWQIVYHNDRTAPLPLARVG